MAQTTNALILKNVNGVTQETYQPNLAFKQANMDNADPNMKTFYVTVNTSFTQQKITARRGLVRDNNFVPADPFSGSSTPIETL